MVKTAVSTRKAFSWPYIELDAQGRAVITGTKMQVSFLIQEREAHGWSPEEVYFQHSDLSLAQIYAAFSYYYDHQEKIDLEIVEEHQKIEQLKNDLKSVGAGYEAKDFRIMIAANLEKVV